MELTLADLAFCLLFLGMNLIQMYRVLGCLFLLSSLTGFAKGEMDFIEILTQDKPTEISSYLGGLDVTAYEIHGLKKKTYYAFENVKLKLHGISLNNISFSFFNDKIGHIYAGFEGEENKDTLLKELTENFGPAQVVEDESLNSSSYTWKGNDSFVYELYYVNYSKKVTISVANNTYRELNAKMRGE